MTVLTQNFWPTYGLRTVFSQPKQTDLLCKTAPFFPPPCPLNLCCSISTHGMVFYIGGLRLPVPTVIFAALFCFLILIFTNFFNKLLPEIDRSRTVGIKRWKNILFQKAIFPSFLFFTSYHLIESFFDYVFSVLHCQNSC